MQKVLNFIKMCTRNASLKHSAEIGPEEKILVFDIDQCLYKSKALDDFEKSNVKNIFHQLSKLGESHWDDITSTKTLFKEIMFIYCNMAPKDFDSRHDSIQFSKFIKTDHELVSKLEEIKLKKFCFTNGSETRARSILSLLKIDHLIEGVICTDDEDTEFFAKPSESSYAFVESYLGIKHRRNIYFFDDSISNVHAARLRGWKSFVVSEDIKKSLDHALSEINSD